jgi:hypothetical protein
LVRRARHTHLGGNYFISIPDPASVSHEHFHVAVLRF